MHGSPQSGDPLLSEHSRPAIPGPDSTTSEVPGSLPRRSALEEPELEAALQLLVERAQYITGATGAALALPHAGEMVCRASAGSCAPVVGARLQVRSGLTGESIARRQLLRCDNAETDPRVNLEACRALGIASIVVLPLLRRNGEVRVLFELFSDHPYAFEERDLIALERMADLTLTALDLAEQRHGSVPSPSSSKQPEKPAEPATSAAASNAQSSMASFAPPEPAPSGPAQSEFVDAEPAFVPARPEPVQPPQLSSPEPAPILESPPPQSAPLPEAMQRVQKCASCGFPVSAGRTLCLDCERKKGDKEPGATRTGERDNHLPAEPPAALAPDELLPPFLANSMLVEESWLARHVNLLAILVLIIGILVAVVVFR